MSSQPEASNDSKRVTQQQSPKKKVVRATPLAEVSMPSMVARVQPLRGVAKKKTTPRGR